MGAYRSHPAVFYANHSAVGAGDSSPAVTLAGAEVISVLVVSVSDGIPASLSSEKEVAGVVAEVASVCGGGFPSLSTVVVSGAGAVLSLGRVLSATIGSSL